MTWSACHKTNTVRGFVSPSSAKKCAQTPRAQRILKNYWTKTLFSATILLMSKSFIHDSFFKEVFSHLKYALDLFRLILTKVEFELFDWTTLRSEATTFINKKGQEKRTDLQFSVQLKDLKERVTLLFLLEHKSRQDPKALIQMLSYQTGIYENKADGSGSKKALGLPPVLPILVYQGKDREWKSPLEFQARLDWTKELKDKFGENVMNFRPRLLNIPALDLKKEAESLTSYPALFILQHIWRVDKTKVRELFALSRDISFEERKFLLKKAGAYIQRHDPTFSWNLLEDIEEKTIENKEERVMTLFEQTVDEACKKSRQEGMQEGRQEGRQEGQKELILKLLKGGFDMQAICKGTGMSQEEINKLKNGS